MVKKMKKINGIIFALVLIPVLTVFSTFSVNAETYLKIGLKYGSSSVSECSLKSESGFFGYLNGAVAFTADESLIYAKAENGVINIYSAKNGGIYYTLDSTAVIEIAAAGGEAIRLNDTAYRGTIMLSADSGRIKIINCVKLESYLKSVVPSEMPASWNIEALKAQAVCARNYALSNLGKYKSQGFDMDDTVSNQVYKGVSAENPNSTKAVEATQGISLLYNGELVQTFFYSSGAGSTEDVENVWGSSVPYLKSVSVPNEYVYEWETVFSSYDLNERLKNAGINVGSVQKVEITGRSVTGRVKEVVITGDKGSYTAKNEKARTVFGLKSALYNLEVSDNSQPLPDISGYSPSVQGAILGKYIFERIFNPLGFNNDAVYTFKGQGYGHGVGMSQYGAKALADSGYTYDKILTHFYTGSYIQQN